MKTAIMLLLSLMMSGLSMGQTIVKAKIISLKMHTQKDVCEFLPFQASMDYFDNYTDKVYKDVDWNHWVKHKEVFVSVDPGDLAIITLINQDSVTKIFIEGCENKRKHMNEIVYIQGNYLFYKCD